MNGGRSAAIFPHALAWLVLMPICERLAPGRRARSRSAAMAIVLAGRVLFAGMTLEPGEIAGMAIAFALWYPLSHLPPKRGFSLIAAGLVALIAIQGLACLSTSRFRRTDSPFVPFVESLTPVSRRPT